jgi:alanyl-tRNA synthetase
METKRLFRTDAYMRVFDAAVLECIPKGENYVVVLDQTAFYPEGGGQPADRGTLGDADVLDVHEKNGRIEHTVDRPLVTGSAVRGEIDWWRRFSFMQMHTAEHMVSGIAALHFGLTNVGFHLNESAATVDLDGPLDADQLTFVEREANRAVWENLTVAEEYPDAETLQSMSYRSKKELTGEVRIVRVPGVDCCACCGTHVAHTGEIGLIKLLFAQRYKGGVRFSILCGAGALEDYITKDLEVGAIANLFSTNTGEAAAAVRRLLQENEALRQRAASLQKEIFAQRCERIDPGDDPVCLFEEELSPVGLREFSTMLAQRRGGVCAVFSGSDEAGYRYAMASSADDMRVLSREMHKDLGGRGGGSRELAQGAVTSTKENIGRWFGCRGQDNGAV